MEPFYLGVGGSSRFCIHWQPPADARVRGAVLYVHPFAEEMNKSRRMAALQARRFAEAGWAVLQIDLLGCGDSAEDLSDASVRGWEADLDVAAAWLCARYGTDLVLWGLRLGALLGFAWMNRSQYRQHVGRMMLWQPVRSGRRHLDQFLRIAVAADRTTGDGTGAVTGTALRQRLVAGESFEVGGYRLSAALAREMDELEIDAFPAPGMPVHWLEVASHSNAQPSPDAVAIADQWHRCGTGVDLTCVEGEPFWSTAEIVECEALLCASTRTLAEC